MGGAERRWSGARARVGDGLGIPGAPLIERTRRLADKRASLEGAMLVFHDSVPEVAGQVCEELLVQAHYYRGVLVSEANVLFLRFAGGPWHRIFIEAGVVFWHAVDRLDTPDQDRHHYTLTDLAAAHGLAGKRLGAVRSVDAHAGGELHLVWTDGGRVIVRHAEGRSSVAIEPQRRRAEDGAMNAEDLRPMSE